MSKGREPSPSARAQARSMRAFDAHLTDAQVAEIARGIAAQREFGAQLASAVQPLANGVEPLTAVRLRASLA